MGLFFVKKREIKKIISCNLCKYEQRWFQTHKIGSKVILYYIDNREYQQRLFDAVEYALKSN